MPITFTCSCGEPLTANERDAGQEVRCPKCGNGLRIPAADVLGYVAPHGGNPTVSNRAVELFRQTTLWVRIMAILMFLGAGFMILAGAGIAFFGMLGQNPQGLVGCVYMPFALLYFIPAVFLWRYASHSKAFSITRHEQSMDEALQAQKSFWKFTAITALVVIGLYILIIPIAIIASIR
jgi:hypothetical protein